MPIHTRYQFDLITKEQKMEVLEKSRLFVDSQYIADIRKGNQNTIENIYSRYYPLVKKYVLQNSGSQDDAKDLFQDTLLVIYKNASRTDFTLTSRFGTYLLGISKNIWLKQLRSRKKSIKVELGEHAHVGEGLEESILWLRKYRIFQKHFFTISQKCQELLSMYLEGSDMASIAKKFEFSSVSYARKRKFQCKEQLIKRIEEDIDFQQIKGDE